MMKFTDGHHELVPSCLGKTFSDTAPERHTQRQSLIIRSTLYPEGNRIFIKTNRIYEQLMTPGEIRYRRHLS